VHDCFTPTELVLYEDLGFSPLCIGGRPVTGITIRGLTALRN